MFKLNRWLFLGALCAVSWQSLIQAQILRATDNATLKATIADAAPTRISVENDRIAVLRGVEGAYTYSNDNTSGAVFLKPSEAYKTKPFYVFINTEKNHNYVLQLKPTSTLSAGILVLKPRTPEIAVANSWDSHASYPQPLTQLMSDMVNRSTPEDYEVILVNAKKTESVGLWLTMRLKTLYSGSHLQGQIYEISNHSLFPVTLAERLFYQPGDRAIALQDEKLPAGGKTFLYKVVSHG